MQAVQVMSALAQSTRLQVFSELARAGRDGLSAGIIAERVGAPANTLSAHLAILSRAKLITSARKGRSIVYKAQDEVLRKLVAFLVKECCDGELEQCRDIIDGLRLDLESAVR